MRVGGGLPLSSISEKCGRRDCCSLADTRIVFRIGLHLGDLIV
jgi:hypothetical protein